MRPGRPRGLPWQEALPGKPSEGILAETAWLGAHVPLQTAWQRAGAHSGPPASFAARLSSDGSALAHRDAGREDGQKWAPRG